MAKSARRVRPAELQTAVVAVTASVGVVDGGLDPDGEGDPGDDSHDDGEGDELLGGSERTPGRRVLPQCHLTVGLNEGGGWGRRGRGDPKASICFINVCGLE